MRIALLADVHANREALEACLEHARAECAERHVFLGDLVGYGADPEWVLETAMRLSAGGALAVLGNHDSGAAGKPDRAMHRDARLVVEWTRPRLSAPALDFLAGLPLMVEDGDRLYVHASARGPGRWDYVHDAEDAQLSLGAVRSRIVFCGHVHAPRLYCQAARCDVAVALPSGDDEIPLVHSRRWLAVLGAVGQPRDGNPDAAYAVFDTDQDTLVFYRVPYDVQEAARKIRAAGLPEWLGSRLAQGR